MNETVFSNMMVEMVKQTPNDMELGELTRALTAKYVQHIGEDDQDDSDDIVGVGV